MDVSGVAAGSSEMWLVQLPLEFEFGDLNGVSLPVSHDASSLAAEGFVAANGASCSVVNESSGLAKQLRLLAPGSDGRLDLLNVSRLITISKDISSMQPPADPYDDDLGPSARPGHQPSSAPSKEQPSGRGSAKKEKRKEKHKEKRKDGSSSSSKKHKHKHKECRDSD